ncbi:MAG: PaaI family thioesterase [Mycobacteriales bacterium]
MYQPPPAVPPLADAPVLDASTDQRLRASIARQTLLTTLGVTVERLAGGRVELAMSRRADLCQQHGFLHAGALTALADSACGYAALSLFPAGRDVLTVNLLINLTAPAAEPQFLAVGSVVRSGRTLTVCRGDVFGIRDDGSRTLVAVVQATMMAVTKLSEP